MIRRVCNRHELDVRIVVYLSSYVSRRLKVHPCEIMLKKRYSIRGVDVWLCCIDVWMCGIDVCMFGIYVDVWLYGIYVRLCGYVYRWMNAMDKWLATVCILHCQHRQLTYDIYVLLNTWLLLLCTRNQKTPCVAENNLLWGRKRPPVGSYNASYRSVTCSNV